MLLVMHSSYHFFKISYYRNAKTYNSLNMPLVVDAESLNVLFHCNESDSLSKLE